MPPDGPVRAGRNLRCAAPCLPRRAQRRAAVFRCPSRRPFRCPSRYPRSHHRLGPVGLMLVALRVSATQLRSLERDMVNGRGCWMGLGSSWGV
jgi:hypothetical protein